MKFRPPLVTVALASILSLGVPIPALQLQPAHAAGFPPVSVPPDLRHVVDLPGTVLPGLSSARRLSPLRPRETLGVAIHLRVRDQAGLDRLLKQIYDRQSPAYHHFLTPRQFATRFAPGAAEQQALVGWLHEKGLRILQRSANGLQLTVRGSVGQIETALGTRLYNYRRGAHSFFANQSPVRVPTPLATDITMVSGLTDGFRATPDLVKGTPDTSRLHGPTHDPQGLGPKDLATLYDFNAFYQQDLNGSGQTIGLFEEADFQDTNIATYDSQFGITPGPLQRIQVSDGQTTGAGLNGEGECELDIQIVHAVAPAATVLVYEGPSFSSVWNQMVSDNRATVLSASWTLPEAAFPIGELWTVHALLAEAAVQGQTVFSSTKDHGAYADTANPNQLEVSYPASDPWVTSVGGTELVQKADGSFGEAAWSNPSNTKEREGGGGGLSIFFSRPDWQTGPGVDEQYSNGHRQLPDVSALAEPDYAMFQSDRGKPGAWGLWGGTSAAAPLWASFMVLIDQQAGQPLGFMNPSWYELGQKASSFQSPPFNDIVDGNNLYYPAGPGWDFATGWGSMGDAAALANDLHDAGVVAYPLPDTIFSNVSVITARKSGSKFVALSNVKRGKRVYLVTLISLYRLPGSSGAKVTYHLLTPAGQSVYTHSRTFTFDATTVGKSYNVWSQVRIPKKLAPGKYVLTSDVQIGKETQQTFSELTVH